MYLAYYNLQEEPFRLTPDPRFLHLAEPHRDALNELLLGIVLRKGFVVLTGPVGTGKTTLLHAALQILTEQSKVEAPLASAFLVNPTLSREEFLEAVLDEYGIQCPATSKPRRLTALHEMLLDRQRRGGTAVLLVDEAHLLSVELLEEIRLLSNLDSYREKLIQIIFSGQPELTTLLAKPELRAMQQRIASRCHLRALSLPETRTYVAERLHAAGLRGSSPFPGPALEAIYRYSQAVPRMINLLCDRALSIGFATQRKLIESDIIEEAAVVLELTEVASPENTNGRSAIAQRVVAPPPKTTTPKSSVDLLIQAMKEGRAFTRE